MTLKAFHVLFVTVSTLMSAGFSAWSLHEYLTRGRELAHLAWGGLSRHRRGPRGLRRLVPEKDEGRELPMSRNPFSLRGNAAKIASEIAIEEINAAGGIGGVPIEQVWYDVGCKAPPAIPVVEKLAKQDKVLAVNGP